MTSNAQAERWTQRLGRGAASLLGRLARTERSLVDWLERSGVSAGLANGAIWICRLALLGAMLYLLFWTVVLLVVVAGVIWLVAAADGSRSPKSGEWRDGWDGYGHYENDQRTDHGRLFEHDQD